MPKRKFIGLKLLRRKARQGDPRAQYELGAIYATGDCGVRVNLRSAFNWYLQSSTQNYAQAQYNLGFMYLLGEGVKKDCRKGMYWLKKSGEKGFTMAQDLLGHIYQAGLFGVRPNGSLAVKWYSLAIGSGNYKAECELGLMYLYGRGVKTNTRKGLALIRSADKHGYEHAKKYLMKIQ